MVIFNDAYDSIPNSAPFIRPEHPGPFLVTIPRTSTATSRQTRATTGVNTAPVPSTTAPTITAAVVTQQKADYDEKLRLYNETQAVEQALRQQLQEAIEPEYLDAMRDVHTHMIQDTIPNIIDYLQKNIWFPNR